jgi:acyl-CoA reductase-like NAD-dependent aldehyde dehydrogenase
MTFHWNFRYRWAGEIFVHHHPQNLISHFLTHSPIAQCPGEISTMLHRAEYMTSIAFEALADVPLKDTDKPGFRRYIKRTPLGVVLVIVPWK